MGLKGGPTQDEIMAVSLQKLRVKGGDVMVDIGCGTAKISIEASRICKSVYSIDRRTEAVEYAKHEIEDAERENVILIHGEASSVLDEIGTNAFDCAFVGGTGDIESVLEKLNKMVSGRIVVNAVLLGTVSKTIKKMKELGIFREVVHIQVSRSYELTGDIMLKPQNPVYIITGEVV